MRSCSSFIGLSAHLILLPQTNNANIRYCDLPTYLPNKTKQKNEVHCSMWSADSLRPWLLSFYYYYYFFLSSHFNHQHTRSITYFLIYFSLNWAFIFFIFLLIFIFSITYVRKQERKLIQYWILTWFKRDWTELYGFTQFPVLRRSEAMTELGWRGGWEKTKHVTDATGGDTTCQVS